MRNAAEKINLIDAGSEADISGYEKTTGAEFEKRKKINNVAKTLSEKIAQANNLEKMKLDPSAVVEEIHKLEIEKAALEKEALENEAENAVTNLVNEVGVQRSAEEDLAGLNIVDPAFTTGSKQIDNDREQTLNGAVDAIGNISGDAEPLKAVLRQGDHDGITIAAEQNMARFAEAKAKIQSERDILEQTGRDSNGNEVRDKSEFLAQLDRRDENLEAEAKDLNINYTNLGAESKAPKITVAETINNLQAERNSVETTGKDLRGNVVKDRMEYLDQLDKREAALTANTEGPKSETAALSEKKETPKTPIESLSDAKKMLDEERISLNTKGIDLRGHEVKDVAQALNNLDKREERLRIQAQSDNLNYDTINTEAASAYQPSPTYNEYKKLGKDAAGEKKSGAKKPGFFARLFGRK